MSTRVLIGMSGFDYPACALKSKVEMKNPGLMVETEDGRIGRTFHKKPPIDGKIIVYLETTPDSLEFSEKGTLFDPKKIKQIGFID